MTRVDADDDDDRYKVNKQRIKIIVIEKGFIFSVELSYLSNNNENNKSPLLWFMRNSILLSNDVSSKTAETEQHCLSNE